MMVLVTYDVETQTAAGRRRLRQVAKQCLNFGQRVQNSVFECILDSTQLVEVRHRLLSIVNQEKDSLRFYYLGNNWKRRVDHFGAKPTSDLEEPIVI